MTWPPSTSPRRRPSRWLPAALLDSDRSSRSAVTSRAILLAALGVGLVLVSLEWEAVPFSLYAPLVVVAGLYLTPGPLLAVNASYLVEMVVCSIDRHFTVTQVLSLSGLSLLIVLMSTAARSRARLGVQGSRGESMFVDLRDRLRAFGELPDAARRLARRDGGRVGVRAVVLRRLRRRHPVAGRRLARGRPRRRLGEGRPGRDPVPAALRSPGRTAGRAGPPTGSCRPRTTICCGRTGTRASRPPSTSPSTSRRATTRSAARATRRPCSSPTAPGGGRCWARRPVRCWE